MQLSVNFKHQNSSNSIIEEGIRKYELILKEIAENIEKTGSPYGYVSMGSTISLQCKSLCCCWRDEYKKSY